MLKTEIKNSGYLQFAQKHPELPAFILHALADSVEREKQFASKLPELYAKGGLITSLALEQCSSESLANYKSEFIQGENALILGGGLGVDEWAFSKTTKKIVSLEPNIELNGINNFNINKLNISNIIRLNLKAEDFLEQNSEKFSYIYTDPDRRSSSGRQILLKDHVPNIPALLPELFKISNKLYIKCSPLYDIHQAIREIDSVTEIYIISLQGEVKELLLCCDSSLKIANEDIAIHCVNLFEGGKATSSYKHGDISREISSEFEFTNPYFIEAGAAWVKANRYRDWGNEFSLNQIQGSVPYFTGSELPPEGFGRYFKLIHTEPFSLSLLQTYLKKKRIESIHLKVRGLPFKTEEIKKKLKTKDGGEDYIFILPIGSKGRQFFHTRRI